LKWVAWYFFSFRAISINFFYRTAGSTCADRRVSESPSTSRISSADPCGDMPLPARENSMKIRIPRFSSCFYSFFLTYIVTDLIATNRISNCGVGFYASLMVSTARRTSSRIRLEATCAPWPQISGGRDDWEKSDEKSREAHEERDKRRQRERETTQLP